MKANLLSKISDQQVKSFYNDGAVILLWFNRNPKKQGVVYNWLEYNF